MTSPKSQIDGSLPAKPEESEAEPSSQETKEEVTKEATDGPEQSEELPSDATPHLSLAKNKQKHEDETLQQGVEKPEPIVNTSPETERKTSADDEVDSGSKPTEDDNRQPRSEMELHELLPNKTEVETEAELPPSPEVAKVAEEQAGSEHVQMPTPEPSSEETDEPKTEKAEEDIQIDTEQDRPSLEQAGPSTAEKQKPIEPQTEQPQEEAVKIDATQDKPSLQQEELPTPEKPEPIEPEKPEKDVKKDTMQDKPSLAQAGPLTAEKPKPIEPRPEKSEKEEEEEVKKDAAQHEPSLAQAGPPTAEKPKPTEPKTEKQDEEVKLDTQQDEPSLVQAPATAEKPKPTDKLKPPPPVSTKPKRLSTSAPPEEQKDETFSSDKNDEKGEEASLNTETQTAGASEEATKEEAVQEEDEETTPTGKQAEDDTTVAAPVEEPGSDDTATKTGQDAPRKDIEGESGGEKAQSVGTVKPPSEDQQTPETPVSKDSEEKVPDMSDTDKIAEESTEAPAETLPTCQDTPQEEDKIQPTECTNAVPTVKEDKPKEEVMETGAASIVEKSDVEKKADSAEMIAVSDTTAELVVKEVDSPDKPAELVQPSTTEQEIEHKPSDLPKEESDVKEEVSHAEEDSVPSSEKKDTTKDEVPDLNESDKTKTETSTPEAKAGDDLDKTEDEKREVTSSVEEKAPQTDKDSADSTQTAEDVKSPSDKHEPTASELTPETDGDAVDRKDTGPTPGEDSEKQVEPDNSEAVEDKDVIDDKLKKEELSTEEPTVQNLSETALEKDDKTEETSSDQKVQDKSSKVSSIEDDESFARPKALPISQENQPTEQPTVEVTAAGTDESSGGELPASLPSPASDLRKISTSSLPSPPKDLPSFEDESEETKIAVQPSSSFLSPNTSSPDLPKHRSLTKDVSTSSLPPPPEDVLAVGEEIFEEEPPKGVVMAGTDSSPSLPKVEAAEPQNETAEPGNDAQKAAEKPLEEGASREEKDTAETGAPEVSVSAADPEAAKLETPLTSPQKPDELSKVKDQQPIATSTPIAERDNDHLADKPVSAILGVVLRPKKTVTLDQSLPPPPEDDLLCAQGSGLSSAWLSSTDLLGPGNRMSWLPPPPEDDDALELPLDEDFVSGIGDDEQARVVHSPAPVADSMTAAASVLSSLPHPSLTLSPTEPPLTPTSIEVSGLLKDGSKETVKPSPIRQLADEQNPKSEMASTAAALPKKSGPPPVSKKPKPLSVTIQDNAEDDLPPPLPETSPPPIVTPPPPPPPKPKPKPKTAKELRSIMMSKSNPQSAQYEGSLDEVLEEVRDPEKKKKLRRVSELVLKHSLVVHCTV